MSPARPVTVHPSQESRRCPVITVAPLWTRLALFLAMLASACGVASEQQPSEQGETETHVSDPATDDPNVFFFEGFEDVGYVSRFTEVTHLDNQSLVSREPYDGDRCLAFRLKGGDH